MCGLPSILALIPAHMRVSFPRGVGVETHSLTLDAPTSLLTHDFVASYGVGVTQGADSQRQGQGMETKALDMAVAAGLPPRMTYSVAETVKYTGVCRSTIYKEIRAGRLAAFRPHGQERGIRIPAAAVDDWIREGTE